MQNSSVGQRIFTGLVIVFCLLGVYAAYLGVRHLYYDHKNLDNIIQMVYQQQLKAAQQARPAVKPPTVEEQK